MSRKGSLDMVMKNMDPERATKILARTLFKELRNNGFDHKDILNFSKEIVECTADDMRRNRAQEDSSRKDRLLIG